LKKIKEALMSSNNKGQRQDENITPTSSSRALSGRAIVGLLQAVANFQCILDYSRAKDYRIDYNYQVVHIVGVPAMFLPPVPGLGPVGTAAAAHSTSIMTSSHGPTTTCIVDFIRTYATNEEGAP